MLSGANEMHKYFASISVVNIEAQWSNMLLTSLTSQLVSSNSLQQFIKNLLSSTNPLQNGTEVSGRDGHGSYCCPPVVDPYTWIALIAGIALATYFLRVVIIVKMPMVKRSSQRKRRAPFGRRKEEEEESLQLNLLDTMYKGRTMGEVKVP